MFTDEDLSPGGKYFVHLIVIVGFRLLIYIHALKRSLYDDDFLFF